jgi:hypothetical protein
MNVPQPSPLAPSDPLDELYQLFWTFTGMNFAELGDVDGIDHILSCLAASFRRAGAIRQEIHDDRHS